MQASPNNQVSTKPGQLHAATEQTAWALLFYSLGIAMFSMRDLISRAFFTLQDTTTPLVIGIVTVAMNIVLNLLFVGRLEHGGLALATVIATTLGFFLGLITFSKRKAAGTLSWTPLCVSMVKTLASSLLMGLMIMATSPYINSVVSSISITGELVRLLLSVVIGACGYFVFSWILNVPELRIMLRYVTGVVKRINLRVNADS